MQNESDEERECNRKSRPITHDETLETEGGEVFVGPILSVLKRLSTPRKSVAIDQRTSSPMGGMEKRAAAILRLKSGESEGAAAMTQFGYKSVECTQSMLPSFRAPRIRNRESVRFMASIKQVRTTPASFRPSSTRRMTSAMSWFVKSARLKKCWGLSPRRASSPKAVCHPEKPFSWFAATDFPRRSSIV